ncbi:hypothetical protein [Natrononativus amylolyticus]|uniref:hypothetical protein n=1 Tax=Natrononativus amylolyticus TaxID=2963434 RepID=UPI0020CF35AF|nr:hypothetical protein [Natrononativus amylolyticus]
MDRLRSRRALLATIGTGVVGSYGLLTATAGPDRADQPSIGCPDYGDRITEHRCNDHRRVGVALEPSATTLSAPGSITFTLRNRSHRSFRSNLYGWGLHRYANGEWEHVAPERVPLPLHGLHPGGTAEWTLTVRPEADDEWLEDDGYTDVRFADLEAGTYAFGIDGWWGDDGRDAKTALIETFALEV